MRPGAQNCSFYMASGLCKFGEGCKFNHPPEKVFLFVVVVVGVGGVVCLFARSIDPPQIFLLAEVGVWSVP